MASIAGFTTLTPYFPGLGSHNREHYRCFTPIPAVIRHQRSKARARSLHGRPGRHTKARLTHLFIWPAWHYVYDKTTAIKFSERDTKKSLLSQESNYGQAAAYKRCSSSAYSACSVSSRNLDNKHTNTASGSFCTGFWLEQSVGLVGSSVDYYSRGFEIMQGIAEMHLQRNLLKCTCGKADLDCTPLCKCGCSK